MLKIYYRIWVSLYLKIKLAQNGNKNASLILSLIVLSTTNFINIFDDASNDASVVSSVSRIQRGA